MSRPEETDEVGRGALRRRELRERKLHEEAVRWWRKPGVIVFLCVFGLAGVGWGLLLKATRRIPTLEATVDGLSTRLDEATWVLDQMDHGENFKKPAALMPGLPEEGTQRVTVYLALENHADEPREFRGEEYLLVPEIGEEVPPMGALVGEASVGPGQTFNTALHFDFDPRQPYGRLRMKWVRGNRTAYFPIPEPAQHYHLRPRGGEALPPDARLLLPIAKAERGERLYDEVYGCSACHGDPKVPDSNNVGPHLGSIATVAGKRVEGLPAAQYIYQSIIEPGAFIAPNCKGGVPCEEPSAMPEYSALIDLQDAADLLGYLLELRGG